MERLVIFADGTWNSPANKDGEKVVPTNVLSSFVDTIRETCPNGDKQYVYYEEGVGTGDSKDKLLGGAFGKGIDEHIIGLYRFIVERYTPEMEIFLFGFSRGAYTVRSLVGLINNCGILRREYLSKAERAYFIYRSKADKNHPSSVESQFFRNHFSHPLTNSTIKFIGVWDTVGSLGIPFKFGRLRQKYRFHDVQLCSSVENAYHALALDETRVLFAPTLWQQKKGPKYQHQKLEQVWFCGVHADVGGGYAEGKLYMLPLHYLLLRATEHGLQSSLKFPDIPSLKEFAKTNRNESRIKGYKLFPRYYRAVSSQQIKRPIWNRWVFSLLSNIPELKTGCHTNEHLHESVMDRLALMKSPEVRNLDDLSGGLPVVGYDGLI